MYEAESMTFAQFKDALVDYLSAIRSKWSCAFEHPCSVWSTKYVQILTDLFSFRGVATDLRNRISLIPKSNPTVQQGFGTVEDGHLICVPILHIFRGRRLLTGLAFKTSYCGQGPHSCILTAQQSTLHFSRDRHESRSSAQHSVRS